MLKLALWKRQTILQRKIPKSCLTGRLTGLKGWFLEESRQSLGSREV